MHIAFAALVASLLFSGPASAQSLFYEDGAKKDPSCKVFRVANGTSLLIGGKTISPGGDCSRADGPFIKGTAIGNNQIKLSDGRVCTYRAEGSRVRSSGC